ncbi:hypothetical protein HDV00_009845 [Rhizophlyctis rosea]|nr:hypothetical protein HDV00_009845 [Rhizophlyctis rosea]
MGAGEYCLVALAPKNVQSTVAQTLDVSQTPRKVDVYHSIDNGPFVLRGSITYDHTSTNKKAHQFEPAPGVTPLEVAKASEDRNTIYRLSVRGEGVSKELNASAPLCLVYGAKFQDHFTLHVNERGQPWHVDYLLPSADCKAVSQGPVKSQFKTQVTLLYPVPASRPQLEAIVQGTPDGKPPPEKSFLQKYWMYLVPVLILLLLSGGDDQQGGGRR